MAFNKDQFRSLVYRTLEKIGLHSMSAENLLLGTAAQESGFGTYFRQIGWGPARGIFQMELATEKDIWENFLCFKDKELRNKIFIITGITEPDPLALEGNLIYQIAMCRVHYLRVREALPNWADIEGMARYWKQYYNTFAGRGTEEEFINNYRRYLG